MASDHLHHDLRTQLVFLILASMVTLRYIIWPRTFMVTLDHPLQSLYWGTLPMALATIIDMIVFVCVPVWGYRCAPCRFATGADV
jgi:tellurite resistance protein TehA-like permease